MLRNLVALVLLANAVLWAAGQGWFGPRDAGREPERMNAQLNADKIAVLPQPPASAAVAAAKGAAEPARRVCLESQGNDPARAESLRQLALGIAPDADVSLRETPEPGLWMVYLGKYSGPDAVKKRLDELRQLKLDGDFERITDAPSLQPGISLGVFRERERAEARLDEVKKKGVNTAKLIERPSGRTQLALRVDKLDEAQRARLADELRRAGAVNLGSCGG
jgi:hypothetical protein